MATESTQITALKAEPEQKLSTFERGGRRRVAQFVLNLEGEGANTIFELIDLPPNAAITNIELYQDTSSTTTFDVGDSNKQDGLIDGQAVNQALTVSLANQNGGTNGLGPGDFTKKLWSVLGYASTVAAGSKIRVTAKANSAVSSGKLYGNIEYVTD